MSPSEARAELVRLLREDRRPFPLDRAALLLALDEYPGLDLAPYEAVFDEYAARAASLAPSVDRDARARLVALRRVLFEEEGFHGNREEYYDVRNSYLNEVLERKLGIPISLGTVVLGVARRLDWPLYSINFPGHFLLGYATAEGVLAIDPFHGGLILDDEELAQRWLIATSARPGCIQDQLRPAEPRSVLVRMLNNIRLVHAQKREYGRAATATEKVLLVEPGNAMHERDLGYLLLGARQVDRAVHHLQNYLRRCPGAPDEATVREHLDNLRRLAERNEL